MHRGVQQFIRWIEQHRDLPGLVLNPPATSADLMMLEQQLGVPLPGDLRMVLQRFNGGTLPSGTLIPAGAGPGTIEAAVRQFAEAVGADFLDPELLVPFHRTLEGSLLCFDRSAGPVSDTWPIVDYYEDTGDVRLVYRTFDGWCRVCVAEWESPDFDEEFSLEKYLRQGERHVAFEPDVSTAHATVAHAYRRAGQPERALTSYLRAARCTPPLAWCDWEALKLAALLKRPGDALEAAGRLCARAPVSRWYERETTPARVADVVAYVVATVGESSPWLRLLDQLVAQSDDEEKPHVVEVRRALAHGEAPPTPLPLRDEPVVEPGGDADAWMQRCRDAYESGSLRDEDLLLEPALAPLRQTKDLASLLRIRRGF